MDALITQFFGECDEKGPLPGVYPGVPDHVYHSLVMCSSSVLKRSLEVGLRRTRYEMDNPVTPTSVTKEGIRRGSLVHDLVFGDGENYTDSVRVYPKLVGKDRDAAIADMIDHRSIASQADDDAVRLALTNLRNAPEFKWIWEIIDEAPLKEVTIIHEQRGVRCKSKLDLVDAPAGMILDGKTGVVDQESMERKLESLRYDLQAELYTRAATFAFDREFDLFGYVLIDINAPGEMGVTPIGSRDEHGELTDAGANTWHVAQVITDRALDAWRQAEESGYWPPKLAEEAYLDHKPWAVKKVLEA